jgi:hypothetical protein
MTNHCATDGNSEGSSAKCHCCGTQLSDQVALAEYKQWKRRERLLLSLFIVSSTIGFVLVFSVGFFNSFGILGFAVGIGISQVLVGNIMTER